jgi:hypothetical protein
VLLSLALPVLFRAHHIPARRVSGTLSFVRAPREELVGKEDTTLDHLPDTLGFFSVSKLRRACQYRANTSAALDRFTGEKTGRECNAMASEARWGISVIASVATFSWRLRSSIQ